MSDPDPKLDPLDHELAKFAARRDKARRRRGGSLWTQASRVGTVGWLIAVPIVIGALLGHLLDERLDSGITFAMAFIVLGVLAGGYALWRLGFDLREDPEPAPPPPPEDSPS
ncbi:MAG: AtpZ/AtpI family protein [Nannocystaceae bacterium]